MCVCSSSVTDVLAAAFELEIVVLACFFVGFELRSSPFDIDLLTAANI